MAVIISSVVFALDVLLALGFVKYFFQHDTSHVVPEAFSSSVAAAVTTAATGLNASHVSGHLVVPTTVKIWQGIFALMERELGLQRVLLFRVDRLIKSVGWKAFLYFFFLPWLISLNRQFWRCTGFFYEQKARSVASSTVSKTRSSICNVGNVQVQ